MTNPLQPSDLPNGLTQVQSFGDNEIILQNTTLKKAAEIGKKLGADREIHSPNESFCTIRFSSKESRDEAFKKLSSALTEKNLGKISPPSQEKPTLTYGEKDTPSNKTNKYAEWEKEFQSTFKKQSKEAPRAGSSIESSPQNTSPRTNELEEIRTKHLEDHDENNTMLFTPRSYPSSQINSPIPPTENTDSLEASFYSAFSEYPESPSNNSSNRSLSHLDEKNQKSTPSSLQSPSKDTSKASAKQWDAMNKEWTAMSNASPKKVQNWGKTPQPKESRARSLEKMTAEFEALPGVQASKLRTEIEKVLKSPNLSMLTFQTLTTIHEIKDNASFLSEIKKNSHLINDLISETNSEIKKNPALKALLAILKSIMELIKNIKK